MLRRLVLADLKIILRNRQALFWALAFPILFATIFGLFRFDDIGEADVAVVGDRATVAPFVAAVREAKPLRYVCRGGEGAKEAAGICSSAYPDAAAARAAVVDGDLDFALVVDASGAVRLLFDETEADRNSVFLPVVRQIVDELNLRVAGVRPRYALTVDGVSGTQVKYYDFVLPGLVGMGVMSYGIIGLASTIAQYRGQRILRRIRATPLRPRTFLGAIVIAHLLLAVVQALLVLAWGVFVFGGTVHGNLGWILLIVVIGNLTFLNIGFMVAARAESAEAASGLGNAVSMPMMFFSGVFFPTAGLPWILPTLTAFLPLRPMVDAIRDVALDSAGIVDVWPELAQLVAWAIFTYLLAGRIFRFERA